MWGTRFFTVLLAVLLSVLHLAAAEPLLSVGDPAPPLEVLSWARGGPLTLFQSGRIYVIEFWATWCGPCLANIPRLMAIQKKWAGKGVTVIGATSADDWGNSDAAVRKLIDSKGRALDYAIAWALPVSVSRTEASTGRHGSERQGSISCRRHLLSIGMGAPLSSVTLRV
jgi:thiol-disulfide isomerase/thioredoxin